MRSRNHAFGGGVQISPGEWAIFGSGVQQLRAHCKV